MRAIVVEVVVSVTYDIGCVWVVVTFSVLVTVAGGRQAKRPSTIGILTCGSRRSKYGLIQISGV